MEDNERQHVNALTVEEVGAVLSAVQTVLGDTVDRFHVQTVQSVLLMLVLAWKNTTRDAEAKGKRDVFFITAAAEKLFEERKAYIVVVFLVVKRCIRLLTERFGDVIDADYRMFLQVVATRIKREIAEDIVYEKKRSHGEEHEFNQFIYDMCKGIDNVHLEAEILAHNIIRHHGMPGHNAELDVAYIFGRERPEAYIEEIRQFLMSARARMERKGDITAGELMGTVLQTFEERARFNEPKSETDTAH